MDQEKDKRLSCLLDGFLEGNLKTDVPADELLPDMTVDYVESFVKNLPDCPETPVEGIIHSKTESLLDAFLQSSANGSFLLKRTPGISSDAEKEENPEFFRQEELDDSFYTETLARIYLKQHRYDKALEIIRSLYLNFPNKSIYFADQIRYLEKLVRINQKIE